MRSTVEVIADAFDRQLLVGVECFDVLVLVTLIVAALAVAVEVVKEKRREHRTRQASHRDPRAGQGAGHGAGLGAVTLTAARAVADSAGLSDADARAGARPRVRRRKRRDEHGNALPHANPPTFNGGVTPSTSSAGYGPTATTPRCPNCGADNPAPALNQNLPCWSCGHLLATGVRPTPSIAPLSTLAPPPVLNASATVYVTAAPELVDEEPITAYKVANLCCQHGLLSFMGIGMNGVYGVDEHASCMKGYAALGKLPSGHARIPDENCSCGFYARPWPRAQVLKSVAAGQVLLEVELFGKIIEGTEAYRAERQRVLRAEVNSWHELWPPVLKCQGPAESMMDYANAYDPRGGCEERPTSWVSNAADIYNGPRCAEHTPDKDDPAFALSIPAHYIVEPGPVTWEVDATGQPVIMRKGPDVYRDMPMDATIDAEPPTIEPFKHAVTRMLPTEWRGLD